MKKIILIILALAIPLVCFGQEDVGRKTSPQNDQRQSTGGETCL